MRGSGVTLQINLAPTDLPHARLILPHQLRCWADQVEDVILTIDLHRSPNRYGSAWRERLPGLRRLVADCCAQAPKVRSRDVDYSERTARAVAQMFFDGQEVPAKDWLGAPFYAYFQGLASAENRYVFHMDSDMLYGGGSRTWIAEAVGLLQQRTNVVACNPLAGPPTADGELRSQSLRREPSSMHAFSTPHISTRLFLIDVDRLREQVGPLQLMHLGLRRSLQAHLDGNPPYDTAEHTISRAMAARGMVRIDFLGESPGSWALHPPYRSPLFYEGLADLIHRVETGDIPDQQRGCHDINESLIDWSSARVPHWRRMWRRARSIGRRLLPLGGED